MIKHQLPNNIAKCIIAAIAFVHGETTHAQFTTVINVPPDPAPTSVGSDTQLNLVAGGVLASPLDLGATDGSSTNVELNLLGGQINASVTARGDVTVNIDEGEVNSLVFLRDGGVINASGGSGVSGVLNLVGGELNLSGGSAFEHLGLVAGSSANIMGTQFVLDGVDITPSLIPNVPSVVNARDVLLEGVLADGSLLDYFLDSNDGGGRAGDRLSTDSTLTVTLVPEPSTALLLSSAFGLAIIVSRRASR